MRSLSTWQVNWKPLYESVFFYQTPPVPLNFRTELGCVAPMSTWRLNHFVLKILRPNRVGSGHESSPSSWSSTSQPASSWRHIIVKHDDYIIHLSLITNSSLYNYIWFHETMIKSLFSSYSQLHHCIHGTVTGAFRLTGLSRNKGPA